MKNYGSHFVGANKMVMSLKTGIFAKNGKMGKNVVKIVGKTDKVGGDEFFCGVAESSAGSVDAGI